MILSFGKSAGCNGGWLEYNPKVLTKRLEKAPSQ